MNTAFSGSYAHTDVQFLLNPLQLEPIHDLEHKERLIQSGAKHYSEMIAPEWLPTAEYFQIYDEALRANAGAVARDALALAQQIKALRPAGITLVSLARAGTPVGVLLKRFLARYFDCQAEHYSISIIRDRGIDANALDYIRARHADTTLCFIDGWTGKGAIAQELKQSLGDYNRSRGAQVSDALFVISDLAGVATAAGSNEDYLIPSAILNAPVSGLISRTILNELVGPDDWHGCLYYREWAPHDRSQGFIEAVLRAGAELDLSLLPARAPYTARALPMRQWVASIMARFEITNPNLVKPGIGEATRAVLRRAPERVLVKSLELPAVQHLVWLCQDRGVTLELDRAMPINALAIIRKLGDV